MRFFNTEGPVNPDEHYAIRPLRRVNLGELLGMIQAKRYFVLHAPRQTGKTSTLIALRDLLNGGGDFRCVNVNVEVGQAARDDVESGSEPSSVCWRRTPWLRDSDRRGLSTTIEHGVEQTLGYMDRCSAVEGHLVLFDRRGETPGTAATGQGKRWEEKLFRREEATGGRKVVIWGM